VVAVAAPGRSVDFKQLLFPHGTPLLPLFPERDQFRQASFESFGSVKAADGATYVLFALHVNDVPGSLEEIHKIGLARIDSTAKPTIWDLTRDLPEVLEDPGVVLEARGCISYSSEADVLHVSLWSLLSGTGGISGISDVFWRLPIVQSSGGIHFDRNSSHIKELPSLPSSTFMGEVALWRLKTGKLVATHKADSSGAVAASFDEPRQEFPISSRDLKTKLPICALDIAGHPLEAAGH